LYKYVSLIGKVVFRRKLRKMARPGPKPKKRGYVPMAGNPKQELGLTEMQERFARIMASEDLTYTEAAIKAGYSEKAAGVQGSKLMNWNIFPHVVNRVRELKQELAKKYDVTFENHVMRLAQIRDMAIQANNYPAAVSAEKARGQVAGLYVSRQEILVGKIDQMDKHQVLEEIRRLQKEFPALMLASSPVIDVIPMKEKKNEPTRKKSLESLE